MVKNCINISVKPENVLKPENVMMSRSRTTIDCKFMKPTFSRSKSRKNNTKNQKTARSSRKKSKSTEKKSTKIQQKNDNFVIKELEMSIDAIKQELYKKEEISNMKKESLRESTIKLVSNMKTAFDEKCYLEREILQSDFDKQTKSEKLNHILKKVEKRKEISQKNIQIQKHLIKDSNFLLEKLRIEAHELEAKFEKHAIKNSYKEVNDSLANTLNINQELDNKLVKTQINLKATNKNLVNQKDIMSKWLLTRDELSKKLEEIKDSTTQITRGTALTQRELDRSTNAFNGQSHKRNYLKSIMKDFEHSCNKSNIHRVQSSIQLNGIQETLNDREERLIGFKAKLQHKKLDIEGKEFYCEKLKKRFDNCKILQTEYKNRIGDMKKLEWDLKMRNVELKSSIAAKYLIKNNIVEDFEEPKSILV